MPDQQPLCVLQQACERALQLCLVHGLVREAQARVVTGEAAELPQQQHPAPRGQ